MFLSLLLYFITKSAEVKLIMFMDKHKRTILKVLLRGKNMNECPQPPQVTPITKTECVISRLNIPAPLPGLARRERAWWVLKNRTHGVFTVRTVLTQASPENRGLEQLVATTRRRLAIGDTRRSCAVGTTLLLHVRERDRGKKNKQKLSQLTYPIMLHSAPVTVAQMFTHYKVTHTCSQFTQVRDC